MPDVPFMRSRGDVEPMSDAYPAEAHVRRIATLVLTALSLLFIIILAGLGELLAGVVQRESGSQFVPVEWITLGASVALLGLIIPLTYLVRAAWWGPKLSGAQSQHPGTVAFFARRTPQLVEALRGAKLRRGRLPSQFIVTVGERSLELWSGRSHEHLCAIDISDTGVLLAGVLPVRVGRLTPRTRTFFITGKVDGREVTLPLVPVGDRGIAFSSARDANRIVERAAEYLNVESTN